MAQTVIRHNILLLLHGMVRWWVGLFVAGEEKQL